MNIDESYDVKVTDGHGVFENLSVSDYQTWLNEKKDDGDDKKKDDDKDDDEKKDDDKDGKKDDGDDVDEGLTLTVAAVALIMGAVSGFKIAKATAKRNEILRELLKYLQKEGVIYNLKDGNNKATFSYNQYKMVIEYSANDGTYVIKCGTNVVSSGKVDNLKLEEYKKKIGEDIVKSIKGA